MKRFCKTLISLLLSVITLFGLTSCELLNSLGGGEIITATSLSAPTITRIEEDVVYWNSVANADAYVISINGKEDRTTSLSYPISALVNKSAKLNIKVKAKGNGILYSDSEWSGIVTYEYTVDESISSDYYSDYKKYNLGTGINAITGSYLEHDGETFKLNEFLDKKKMSALYDLSYLNAQGTDLLTIDEKDINTFVTRFSAEYTHTSNTNLGFGVDGFGFSNTLSNKFSISGGFNLKLSTDQYYSLSYQTIPDQRVAILNFDPEEIKEQDVLSDYAQNRLGELSMLSGNQLENAILTFFDKMGTHIVTDAVYGGKIEAYYYIVSNEGALDANVALELTNSLEATINYKGAQTGAGSENSLDASLKLNSTSKETNAQFAVNCIGGKGLTANTYSGFASAYKDWIEDFNAQSEHNTMIDISSGGLCPIWELLPTEYSSLAESMKEVFNKKLGEVNEAFFSRFAISETIENNNTTDFAGGNGSEEYPYLISNVVHLSNMGKEAYNKENVYFKLEDDIDLSEGLWTSLNNFKGILDGNGKTIENLSISYAGTSLDSEKTCGIFNYVSGSIKNLKLDNITFEYSSNHEGDGTLMVGALCGKLSGTVENVQASNCHIAVHRDNSCSGIIAGYANESSEIHGVNVTKSTIYSNGDGGFVVGYLIGGKIYNNNISDCKLSYYAVKVNRSNGGIVGYAKNSIIRNCSVTNTQFILDGSSDDLHNYNWRKQHKNCSLKPAMGYIIGTGLSSGLDLNSFKVSDNIIEINEKDKDFVSNPEALESEYWFKHYDGKVGRVQ